MSTKDYTADFQIFTPRQIASLRRGGAILRRCLQHVASLVHPGVKTQELDAAAESFIRAEGALPAFKRYQGYPATLCTSVNEQCVHGIPGDRVLVEGDIISLDCGVLLDHLYTDACITVPVSRISPKAEHLLDVTERALGNALSILRAGLNVGDISSTIQRTVEAEGFHPVRSLTGHGLGTSLHQFPDVPNWGEAGTGPIFPMGTIVAIEPIISAGSDRVTEAADGWTLSTADSALSAHFEHTVLVLQGGCEVLT